MGTGNTFLFIVRGTGFFIASYYLFAAVIINAIQLEQYTEDVFTPYLQTWSTGSTFIGLGLGMLVFGFLSDFFGRQKCMIASNIIILCGGALCTIAYGGSQSTTIHIGIIARGILGFGLGCEWPLVACCAFEDPPRVHKRNIRLALTFTLTAAGALSAGIIGQIWIMLCSIGAPGTNSSTKLEIAWRLIFATGLIPMLIILPSRLRIGETPAYAAPVENRLAASPTGVQALNASYLLIINNFGLKLLYLSLSWFLCGMIIYSHSKFAVNLFTVVEARKKDEVESLAILSSKSTFIALMAFPGYFVACYLVNRLGRREMQLQGFMCLSILFIIAALQWTSIKTSSFAYLPVYGGVLFFTYFGPATTTFISSTEPFPTCIRGRCYGISSSIGVLGASISVFYLSWLEVQPNINYTPEWLFVTLAIMAAIACPITWYGIEDNVQPTLEIDGQFYALMQGIAFDQSCITAINSPTGPSFRFTLWSNDEPPSDKGSSVLNQSNDRGIFV